MAAHGRAPEADRLVTLSRALVLAAAGLLAGGVNGAVGTGSLISFPALVATGYPALTSNFTNTIALLPGFVGNAIGYRRELSGQRARMRVLGCAMAAGSIGGCIALFAFPPSAFRAVVPYFVFLGAGLMATQKYVAGRVAQRRAKRAVERGAPGEDGAHRDLGVPLVSVVVLAGAYAGYFGAGVSVVLLAVLGATIPDTLQRLNALRSVLAFAGNALAGVIFAVFGTVAWPAVVVMAPAALAGGWIGSSLARRIPEDILRWCVVAFAVAVGVALLVG